MPKHFAVTLTFSYIIFLLYLVPNIQANELICKAKKILHLTSRPPKKTRRLADTLLKKLGAKNRTRVKITLNKLKRIIHLFLPYAKKKFKSLPSIYQKYYLYPYLVPQLWKISEIKIICNKGEKFLWYIILGHSLFIIGNDRKVLVTYPLTYNNTITEKWEARRAVCDLTDSTLSRFAIEVWNRDILGNYYEHILTKTNIYSNSKISRPNNGGKFAVEIKTRNGKYKVWVDEQEGKEYDGIHHITFSHDNKKYGYIATLHNKYVAVVNNVESDEYDEIAEFFFEPTYESIASSSYWSSRGKWYTSLYTLYGRRTTSILFLPGNNRFLYVAKKKDKWMVVVDNTEGPEYDGIDYIVLSPDGKSFAYKARLKKEQKTFEVLNINGKKTYEYEHIVNFYFAPKGKRYASVIEHQNIAFVIVDGKKEKEYANITNFMFSPDGKRYAYTAKKFNKSKWVVAVSGVESEEYDYVEILRFSPKRGRVAYSATIDNNYYIVLDGKKNGPYNSLGFFTFSKDEKKFIYFAKKNTKWHVVINGKESTPYDAVYGLSYDIAGGNVFTINNRWRDGWTKNNCFYAQKGTKYVLVCNGKESEEYEGIKFFSLSKDQKKYSYVASRDGNWFAVINGVESEKYMEISYFNMSFDGNSYHFYATDDGKRYKLIVNGKEIIEFDALVQFTQWNNYARYGYIVRDMGGYVVGSGNKKIGNYSEMSYNIEFTRDGNLVSSGYDGNKIKLYINEKSIEGFQALSSNYFIENNKVTFLSWRWGKLYKVDCK